VTTAEGVRQPGGAFAALTSRSYRIYLGGQSLANTGTWMQSIAQDWLVYDLTHSSTSVGVTMALQFLPILVLGLLTGGLADRLPKRRILLTTQTLNAAATTALAVITIAGAVRAADVYAFALLSGLIFAFDSPARQAFVSEVVPPDRLRAAIALNAAVFQATRLIGPAIAALLIANVGTGWVFAVNATCYAGPVIGLLRLRPSDLRPAPAARREPGALRATARYLARRPDVTNLAFQAMANASVQLAVDARLRGRVMGLYMLAFIGGTPIGAPLIGLLTSHFGARAGMTVCGVVPVLAAAVVAVTRRRRAEAGGWDRRPAARRQARSAL
jgi:MFS family permease